MKYVPVKSMDELKQGDVVRFRHGDNGTGYTLLYCAGDSWLAVAPVNVSNPSEWERLVTDDSDATMQPEVLHYCPNCGNAGLRVFSYAPDDGRLNVTRKCDACNYTYEAAF